MTRCLILALALLAGAAPALAQDDLGTSEIIVTASRRQADDYNAAIPAVGLRKIADFALQRVVITGDTRDTPKRREEIYAMIRGAIELAGRRPGVELATGEMVVERLTAANYKDLPLSSDGRPDTDRAFFLVKTSLAGGDAKAALDRIDAFIKSVPAVGRAELRAAGDLTLSVVSPNQYRGRILDLVAADARETAGKLGPDYRVSASGLDRPVEWTRASLTEVFLYLPYSYAVVPVTR